MKHQVPTIHIFNHQKQPANQRDEKCHVGLNLKNISDIENITAVKDFVSAF